MVEIIFGGGAKMKHVEVWPVVDSSFSHHLQHRWIQKLYLSWEEGL